MVLKGSCHCGKTAFEVTEEPQSVTRCTCTICSKRGALWAYYKPSQFKLTTPEENIATYKWQTKSVSLNFCAICGCTTFNVSPDWSTGKPDFENMNIAVNARILDDFDLENVQVKVIDGRNLW